MMSSTKRRGGTSRKKGSETEQLVELLVKRVIELVDKELRLIPTKLAKVIRVVHHILFTAR